MLEKAQRVIKLMDIKPHQSDDTRGIWYYGAPGVGKSHRAFVNYPGAFRKS
jgi:DNA replication protein DnaC